MNRLTQLFRQFATEDDGAQIIEYALIVAVVSLALIAAIQTDLVTGSFTTWLTTVGTCLEGGACELGGGAGTP